MRITDYEGDQWRITRLIHAFSIALTSALPVGKSENNDDAHDLLTCIDRIHDHKGNLEVTWNKVPSASSLFHIELAWAAVGECRENVGHYVIVLGEEVTLEDAMAIAPRYSLLNATVGEMARKIEAVA